MIGVVRSKKIPESLRASSSPTAYRNTDVVEQLVHDFHDKCYICEVRPVDDPEVEHLLPHKGGRYEERLLDWNNLFYVCRHCNSVKNKAQYDQGVIDCCRRDPEKLLVQELVGNRVHVVAVEPCDDEAKRTSSLIEEVFMSENPALRRRAADARLKKLQLRMNALYTKLAEYKAGGPSAMVVETLAAMLSKEAAFAGFTRCYVREHLDEYPGLEKYVA